MTDTPGLSTERTGLPMPDENRSERLPSSTRNEPPLQRAVLLFLVEQHPAKHSFKSLVENGLGDDPEALLRAIKSLHIALLIDIDGEEQIRASFMAAHFHWLLNEVPADA